MKINVGEIAVALAKHGCVLVGEFKLSSGLTSPYYIDLRTLPSHPELFELVADTYVSFLKETKITFDRVAGIATAGIPIATLVAYKMGKPFLYVRKENRAHGTQRLVEGVADVGDVVLLIDDVTTTGGNLRWAIEALRGRGVEVNHAIVLVDREQGAKEKLEAIGVRLLPIVTSSKLMEELHSRSIISSDEYEKIVNYIGGGKLV